MAERASEKREAERPLATPSSSASSSADDFGRENKDTERPSVARDIKLFFLPSASPSSVDVPGIGDVRPGMAGRRTVDFERPIVTLEKRIEEMEIQAETDGLDLSRELHNLEEKVLCERR